VTKKQGECNARSRRDEVCFWFVLVSSHAMPSDPWDRDDHKMIISSIWIHTRILYKLSCSRSKYL